MKRAPAAWASQSALGAPEADGDQGERVPAEHLGGAGAGAGGGRVAAMGGGGGGGDCEQADQGAGRHPTTI